MRLRMDQNPGWASFFDAFVYYNRTATTLKLEEIVMTCQVILEIKTKPDCVEKARAWFRSCNYPLTSTSRRILGGPRGHRDESSSIGV